MSGDRFEEFLAEAARGYNAPSRVPREEMWARIEQARRFLRRAAPVRRAWVSWGVGAAAVLLIGIAIGRYSGAPDTARMTTAPATEAAQEAGALPYRLAALQHLTQAEALITSFRAAGEPQADVRRWAADLLGTTRLMLDSPAAEDQQLRQLLEDLELVLAQMAQLPSARAGDERQFIDEAIEQKNVLPRLRATVPSGPVRTSI